MNFFIIEIYLVIIFTQHITNKMFNEGSNLPITKEEKEAWKNFAATAFKVTNTTINTTTVNNTTTKNS